MKNLISKILDTAHRFSGVDFAIFKICLLSIGVLLGVYFHRFFAENIIVVWFIGAFAMVYMWIQIIQYLRRGK